jgi:hypothetical protein
VGNQKYIIEQMETYIRQGGGEYGDWFIGLADNPIAPITETSRLRKVQNHRFTYVETISVEVAKSVADYFINACGMDGNISETEKMVPVGHYIFIKKSSISSPAKPAHQAD